MGSPNVNEAGYDRRLAVVRSILDRLGLTATSITPVAYEESLPFHYNNFIYKLDLAAPATAANFAPAPCTTPPLAEGISTLILRLCNAKAECMNNSSRIENDVIAASLIRQSLARRAPDLAAIVPAVYAWAPFADPSADAEEAAYGWTLMEHRPGSNLYEDFAQLDRHDQNAILDQIATILAAIQAVRLPAGVTGHGGLTLDKDGAIVSGERSIVPAGPWSSYADVWAARLQFQLDDAERSTVLRGWRDDGNGALRARLDAFIHGPAIDEVLRRGGVDAGHRVLTHGDFTINNMLYDPATKRLSALLDYDWAAVTHPAHEFFSGLHELGSTHPRDAAMQAAVLTGNFDTAASDAAADSDAWALARYWDAALLRAGGQRPSSIAGIATLESLRALEDLIAPTRLTHSFFIARTPAEKLQVARAETAAKLEALLDKLAGQA